MTAEVASKQLHALASGQQHLLQFVLRCLQLLPVPLAPSLVREVLLRPLRDALDKDAELVHKLLLAAAVLATTTSSSSSTSRGTGMQRPQHLAVEGSELGSDRRASLPGARQRLHVLGFSLGIAEWQDDCKQQQQQQQQQELAGVLGHVDTPQSPVSTPPRSTAAIATTQAGAAQQQHQHELKQHQQEEQALPAAQQQQSTMPSATTEADEARVAPATHDNSQGESQLGDAAAVVGSTDTAAAPAVPEQPLAQAAAIAEATAEQPTSAAAGVHSMATTAQQAAAALESRRLNSARAAALASDEAGTLSALEPAALQQQSSDSRSSSGSSTASLLDLLLEHPGDGADAAAVSGAEPDPAAAAAAFRTDHAATEEGSVSSAVAPVTADDNEDAGLVGVGPAVITNPCHRLIEELRRKRGLNVTMVGEVRCSSS
jgi:hypothetical protein